MNDYFSNGVQNIGTDFVDLYKAPDNATAVFITGLYVANVTDKNTFVEVVMVRGTEEETKEIHLTSSETPLPSGSTLTIATPGQSLHMEASNAIKVRCLRESSADAYITGYIADYKDTEEEKGKTFCEDFLERYVK